MLLKLLDLKNAQCNVTLSNICANLSIISAACLLARLNACLMALCCVFRCSSTQNCIVQLCHQLWRYYVSSFVVESITNTTSKSRYRNKRRYFALAFVARLLLCSFLGLPVATSLRCVALRCAALFRLAIKLINFIAFLLQLFFVAKLVSTSMQIQTLDFCLVAN